MKGSAELEPFGSFEAEKCRFLSALVRLNSFNKKAKACPFYVCRTKQCYRERWKCALLQDNQIISQRYYLPYQQHDAALNKNYFLQTLRESEVYDIVRKLLEKTYPREPK
ncbi:hypothetical protein CIPAW_11G187700 [Carya illinoinensis]|uniref:Uncharacterized protein n=1 Tax=Carya illinoinensis TaxID=32201 RepID=A0A8T1P6Z5_CARIL|nr:hypothetical protein CIPAW_11G187700 [Carya illinoinensis]